MFVKYPWPRPRAVTLDVKLFQPLQGVDTTLVTNSHCIQACLPFMQQKH